MLKILKLYVFEEIMIIYVSNAWKCVCILSPLKIIVFDYRIISKTLEIVSSRLPMQRPSKQLQ